MPPKHNETEEIIPSSEVLSPETAEDERREVGAEDPETAALSAVAAIEGQVVTIEAEAEKLHDSIPEALGVTEAEVARVEGDMGFVERVRDVGRQISEIATEAKNRITEVLSRASGSMRRDVNVVAAAAIIGVAGNIPNAEAPEVKTQDEVVAEMVSPAPILEVKTTPTFVTEERVTPEAVAETMRENEPVATSAPREEVRPDDISGFMIVEDVIETPEARKSDEEHEAREVIRKSWHEEHRSSQSIATLKDYRAFYAPRDDNSKKVPVAVESAVLDKAFADIQAMLGTYPKELRKQIMDDPQFLESMNALNAIRNFDFSEEMGELVRTNSDALNAFVENAKKAITIAHHTIEEMHTDMQAGVIGTSASRNSRAVMDMASLYNEHVDNSMLLADEHGDAKFLASVPSIANEVFAGLSPLLQQNFARNDMHSFEQVQLLAFLAQSGHKEGTDLLVKKIREGNFDLRLLSTVFNDKEKGKNGLDKKIYEDPTYLAMGKGGETVSTALLQSYGLPPERYLELWKRPDWQGTRNGVMSQNTRRIVDLETGHPGSMERLTGKYGIYHPGRYSKEILLDQLATNKEAADEYGTAISALDDTNGVFNGTEKIDELHREAKAQGIKLRVAEAGSQIEAAQRLLYIVETNGRKMSFIGVRGHGEKDSTRMGEGAEGKIDAEFLGVGPDRSSLILEDGAPIYFESCSTGIEGGIAEKLSGNVTGEVTAPDNDTNIEILSLQRKADGKLSFQIKYRDFEKPVYAKTYFRGKEIVGAGTVIPKPFDVKDLDSSPY